MKANGFRRGFLLSSNSKSKKAAAGVCEVSQSKRKTKVSSELLNISENKASTFLVCEEECDSVGDINESSPILQPQHRNESLLDEPQSRNRRPLIQEVLVENTDLSCFQEDQSRPLDKIHFLPENDQVSESHLVQVETKLLAPTGLPVLKSHKIKEEEGGVESHLESDRESLVRGPITMQEKVLETTENDNDQDPKHQLLAALVWKLLHRAGRRSKLNDDTAELARLCGQSTFQWKFVWEAILENASFERPKKCPSCRLALDIFQQRDSEVACMEAFLSFFSPEENSKTSRQKALAATTLVQEFMRHRLEAEQNHLLSRLWQTRVSPDLVCLAKSDQSRSVLSQHCATAAYQIMEDFVQAIRSHEHDIPMEVSSDFENSLPRMEQLLGLQETWLQQRILDLGGALSADEISRRRCTQAVFEDWKRLFRQSRRDYERVWVEMGRDRVCHCEITKRLCDQASGTQLDGITFSMGGIHQTILHDTGRLIPDQILNAMRQAEKLSCLVHEQRNLEFILRSIVRGVSSWLGQSKKHLVSLRRQIVPADHLGDSFASGQACDASFDIARLTINLLRSSSEETADLALVILNRLWSSSHGLPPDIVGNHVETGSCENQTVPPTFAVILCELKASDEESCKENSLQLAPSVRALCVLTKNCIVHGGIVLMKELLTRNGLRNTTIEVMAMLLSHADGQTERASGPYATDKCVVSQDDMYAFTGKVFLENLGSNAYIQHKLMHSPGLLSQLPLQPSIPSLLQIIFKEVSTPSDVSNTLISVASEALEDILTVHLKRSLDDLICLIVEFFSKLQDHRAPSPDASRQPETLIHKTCQRFSGRWRRALLRTHVGGDDGFATLLVAIAKAMFRRSTSDVALVLLGSVVGDGSDLDFDSAAETERISLSIVVMVVACVTELECCSELGPASDRTERLCGRLAPLVLLRRLPAAYWKVAWACTARRDEIECALMSLADQLALRLDIESSEERKDPFTPEERRISAELAGIGLPFFGVEKCSCFHRICVPAFSSLLGLLRNDLKTPISDGPERIRIARAALYSVCHFITRTESKTFCGDGLLAVSSVVFKLVNVRATKENRLDSYRDGLVQLQTGCIEFVAFCLEGALRQSLQSDNSQSKQASKPLVSEFEPRCLGREGADCDSKTTGAALRDICTSVISSLEGKEGSACHWSQLRRDYFEDDSQGGDLLDISPEARTCLWNAVLLVSKRCPDEEQRLLVWARRTARWVLDWGTVDGIDSQVRHPLCMTAALEVLFTLITRTKTLACLAGTTSVSSSVVNCVRRAHELSLNSIKVASSTADAYTSTVMKRAALKLMLAIVSIEDETQYLDSGEITATFTVLQGAANIDPDPEFRKLAGYIIHTLQAH